MATRSLTRLFISFRNTSVNNATREPEYKIKGTKKRQAVSMFSSVYATNISEMILNDITILITNKSKLKGSFMYLIYRMILWHLSQMRTWNWEEACNTQVWHHFLQNGGCFYFANNFANNFAI